MDIGSKYKYMSPWLLTITIHVGPVLTPHASNTAVALHFKVQLASLIVVTFCLESRVPIYFFWPWIKSDLFLINVTQMT